MQRRGVSWKCRGLILWSAFSRMLAAHRAPFDGRTQSPRRPRWISFSFPCCRDPKEVPGRSNVAHAHLASAAEDLLPPQNILQPHVELVPTTYNGIYENQPQLEDAKTGRRDRGEAPARQGICDERLRPGAHPAEAVPDPLMEVFSPLLV